VIHLDISITLPPGTEKAEEAIKVRLRQHMLQFIFEHADAVADNSSMGVRHTDIEVTGSIKVV
jgi:hypothetical protein